VERVPQARRVDVVCTLAVEVHALPLEVLVPFQV